MQPHRRRRVVPLVLGVLSLAACDFERPSTRDGVVEDSAGIEIVTSHEPRWTTAQRWQLSPQPMLVLGGPDAVEGEELWRISGLARTPDGRVAVSLVEAAEVRIYDVEGHRVATLGRPGEGPGELQRPSSLAILPPDTVLVLDGRQISRFLLDGTFIEQRRLPRPDVLGSGTAARPMFVLADGSMMGAAHRYGNAPPPEGIHRPDQGAVLFPTGDADPVLLGWYGGIEQERLETGRGQRSIVAPFARHTTFAAGLRPTPRYVVGDNERYEIHTYDASGALRRIVRRAYEPVPVRPEWIEEWKQRQREADWTTGQLPSLERGWQQMTVRETLPPFQSIHMDAEGHLWILRSTGGPSEPPFYEVSGPDGHLLGRVNVPEGFRPWPVPAISREFFVGVWTGELNIESVRAYEIKKPM